MSAYWINNLPEEVADVARGCGAPICIVHMAYMSGDPRNCDFKRANGGIWYPDEEICSCFRKKAVKEWLGLEDGEAPKWIKRQRNIAKKAKRNDLYFTAEMLNVEGSLKGTAKGIDPDRDEEEQIAAWFRRREKDRER